MNILQQEDLVKGLPDQALMQQAQMPTGELPQFLVVSEIQRREKMRKSFSEAVPENSIKDQVLSSGIAAMNPTPDPLMGAAMGAQGGQDPMQQQMQQPMQDPMMQQQMMAAGGGMMPYRMEGGRDTPNLVTDPRIAYYSMLESVKRTIDSGELDADGMNQFMDAIGNKMKGVTAEDYYQIVDYLRASGHDVSKIPSSRFDRRDSVDMESLQRRYGIPTEAPEPPKPSISQEEVSQIDAQYEAEYGESLKDRQAKLPPTVYGSDIPFGKEFEDDIPALSLVEDNRSVADMFAGVQPRGLETMMPQRSGARSMLPGLESSTEMMTETGLDSMVRDYQGNQTPKITSLLASNEKLSPVKDIASAEALVAELERTRKQTDEAGLPRPSVDSNAMREDLAKGVIHERQTTGSGGEVDPILLKYITAKEAGTTKVNERVEERQAAEALDVVDEMSNALYEIQKGDTLYGLSRERGTTVDDIMALNPQIEDRDLIYAGDTLNLSGGGITSYKMNAGRKTYSAEELAAIEALIAKGYSKEEAENIVRFTPTGETQEEIAESIYDYRSPTEAGRRGKRRIPGGETRESLMKRVIGDDVPDYMYSAHRGRGARSKFMDLATQGNVLDQFLPNQLPATVTSPFDASASEEVTKSFPGNTPLRPNVSGNDSDGFQELFNASAFNAMGANVNSKNKGAGQSNPIDFLSELQGFKTTYGGDGSSLGKLDYSGKDARTDFEGLLDAERARSLEATKEMKADAMNNALVQLGAGIASGDLSKGISNAGTVAMQGRKEARAEEKGMTGLERQMKLLGAQESSSIAREQIKANADIAKFNLQQAISEDKNTLDAFKALRNLEIQRESADTAAKKQILDEKIGEARIHLLESQAGWYASGGSAKNPIAQAQAYYKNMGAKSQLELRKKHGSEAAAIQAIVAMMTSGEIDPMAMSGGPAAPSATGGGGHSILSVRD